MKVRITARLLSVILALALVAAACGDDEASEQPADAAAQSSTGTEAPAAPAEVPDDEEGAPEDADTSTEASDEVEAPEPEADEAPEPATEEPEDEAPATTEPAGPKRVAYLSASSANTFLLASVGEMERLAAENNIELVEFDAQFNADLQTTQLQDVVASGQYDGIILVALERTRTGPRRGGGPGGRASRWCCSTRSSATTCPPTSRRWTGSLPPSSPRPS